jgi:hypothetical protein
MPGGMDWMQSARERLLLTIASCPGYLEILPGQSTIGG